MPIVEIYVLIQVGQVIGVGWTVLLLVLDSILGGWLIRREGRARGGRCAPRWRPGACPRASWPTAGWSCWAAR